MSKATPNIDSTGSGSLAQFPPPISLDSLLLSSIISLPAKPLIAYAVFTPAASDDNAQQLSCIESARRSLAVTNGHLPVLESLLCTVHITQQSPALYVFTISSAETASQSHANLNSLSFDGLIVSEPDFFSPHDLYPCSHQCSFQRQPCPSCLNPRPPSSIPSSPQPSSSTSQSSPSVDCLLPRRPLRSAYSHFLKSIREHLIHQISETATNSEQKSATRLGDGFLLQPSYNHSEWGVGWDHHSTNRTLVHCQLEVHLSPTRLTIHPILWPTHFIPLQVSNPTHPGVPITILPYGTPAFYLAMYRGPTSAITSQFDTSLAGLGAGNWKNSKFGLSSPDVSNVKDPTYVIAWISVQNKQGEDKGIPVIWPASLCLTFLPSAPQARSNLCHIPELPPQLQPSPPPPAPPSATIANISLASPIEVTPPTAVHQVSSRPFMTRAQSSPMSDSVRALRALTINKSKRVPEIAHEVSGYVDFVAKERERERERLRKERETIPSPSKVNVTPSLDEPQPLHTSIPDLNMVAQTEMEEVQTDASAGQLAGGEGLPLEIQDIPMIEGDTPSTVDPSPAGTNATLAANVAFDPFSGFDPTWAQPTSDFSSIGLEYDIGETRAGGDPERFDMDLDDGFGAFTDDDFSFFDRPAAHGRSHEPSLLQLSSIGMGHEVSSLGLTSPLFGEGTLGTGPGPPSATPGASHPSPWTSGILGEGFTPRFNDPHVFSGNTPAFPDILPSSPTHKSPLSHSAPPTPGVRLVHESSIYRPPYISRPTVFDPIAFDYSHRQADDKYALGKFALPSPPDEEDRTESLSSIISGDIVWKNRYNAITDPRISIVRKLIGAKRKSFEQGGREGKMSPLWVREQEEWEQSIIRPPEDGKSEAESDEDEDDDGGLEEFVPTMGPDRPSTPLPSYLPLGPSLLATQFHHSHLLPISTALRSPGAAVAAINLTATVVPMNVPTPVSPPAMLGEKSRSLEAAANMLAKEVVENPVWAESLRWRMLDSTSAADSCVEVSQVDVKRTANLFRGLGGLEGPVQMGRLFSTDSASVVASTDDIPPTLQPMDPPLLSTGKSDIGVEVLPPALRFWEKLGLVPKGGVKPVTAYVFFEDRGEDQSIECATAWLNKVSAAYSARNFGSHSSGSSGKDAQSRVFPVHFDSFRKDLHIVAKLPPMSSHVVFYIVAPHAVTTLASPILRQIFSAAKRILKSYSETWILFQLVPESAVFNAVDDNQQMHALVTSVYDRILVPVDRSMSRSFFDRGATVRRFFQDPSFTLGRPRQKRLTYVPEARTHSLDVLDRHLMLHVAYRVSSCGKWLLAACVDQRGENHDLAVWLQPQDEGGELSVVDLLWSFAVGVAKSANVEWRIVFAKTGPMAERELGAWFTKLASVVPECEEVPMVQVTLVAAELDAPWALIAPEGKTSDLHMTAQSKNPAGHRFEDVSAATYALLPPVPMSLSPVAVRLRDSPSSVQSVEDHDDVPASEMTVRALSTATIIRVPASTDYTSISMLRVHLLHTIKSRLSSLSIADEETHLDIMHNFHELAVLSNSRWRARRKVNSILPFHLAALEAMDVALAGGFPSE